MDKKTIMELRIAAQKLKPTLHIGKDGMNESVIEEVRKQLKKSKIVKVRVLSSIEGDRQEIASGIAGKTGSAVIDVRGSTIVLARD